VGSLSYADGDKYVGEWAAGKKNGEHRARPPARPPSLPKDEKAAKFTGFL